jgi:hypothetical protein
LLRKKAGHPLRRELLTRGKDIQHTLKTLRYKRFAKAGYLTTQGRTKILKLAIAMQHREWCEGVWDAAKTCDLPVRFDSIFLSRKHVLMENLG